MATNNVFIIHNTAGVPVAAIQPDTLNGPDGVQQSSDLRLYGLGFATWGEGVDENDYRIVESWACQDMSAFPTSPRYAALSLAGTLHNTPASAVEIGDGNGINVPIVGQIWFNLTLQSLYVYNNTNLFEPIAGTIVFTGASPPTGPTLGTLWFDGSQLNIFNGTSFVSVALNYLPLAGGTMTGAFSMGSFQIHNLLNPTAPQDAATKQYVDTVASGSGAGIFLPLAGGTMTGNITMSGATSINLNSGNVSTNGNFTATVGTLTLGARVASATSINAGGGRIIGVSNTIGALTDAVNSTSGDIRWLNKSTGGPVTGPVTFSGSTVVPTPTIATQAATKGYVDGTFHLAANGYQVHSSGLIKIWGSVVVPGSGLATVNFLATSGKTFPTACFGVQITIVQPSSSGAGLGVPFVFSVNAAGFSSDNTSGSVATTIYWEATGH